MPITNSTEFLEYLKAGRRARGLDDSSITAEEPTTDPSGKRTGEHQHDQTVTDETVEIVVKYQIGREHRSQTQGRNNRKDRGPKDATT
jgi:hypothetical protein